MIFAFVMLFGLFNPTVSDNKLAVMVLLFTASCVELYHEHPHLMRLLDSFVK